MQDEIKNAAKKLGISEEDAQLKFEEICKVNGVTTDSTLSKGLWRSYASQQIRMKKKDTSGSTGAKSFGSSAFGFFVALEEPRDMMAYNRRRAVEEWKRDAFNAYNTGIVATVEQDGDKYAVSRMFDGEEQTRVMSTLSDGAEYLEDGSIIIPLDSTKNYANGGENKNYGKPLAKQLMRRSGIFIGKVDGESEYSQYLFSYKNQNGVDFVPNCFEWLHMPVIKDSNREGYIYGYTKKTLQGLTMNADLDTEGDEYRDTSQLNVLSITTNVLDEKVISLSLLDATHLEQRDLPSAERFIVTMGTVCNMNMTPTSNGNRILNITDLEADFDYDSDGMTTCWVPSHIEIDFGIGSEVVVVGRTSQREGDDGYEPATINLSGLYVSERKGQVAEISEAEDENLDWF